MANNSNDIFGVLDAQYSPSYMSKINELCLALAEENLALDSLSLSRREVYAPIVKKQCQLISTIVDQFDTIPSPLISPILNFAEFLAKTKLEDDLSWLIETVEGFADNHLAHAQLMLIEIKLLLTLQQHEKLLIKCPELALKRHFLPHRQFYADAHHAFGLALFYIGQSQAGIAQLTASLLSNPSGETVKPLKIIHRNSWIRLLLLSRLPILARLFCTLDMLKLRWVSKRLAYLSRYRKINYLPANRNGSGILVMRAMGGIGDLLMMTVGLKLLHDKYPKHKLDFAIQRKYFSLFENNPVVNTVDIAEITPGDIAKYHMVFNLTECPASRVESRSVPNVKANRIDIFAKALGANQSAIERTKRQLVYNIGSTERGLASTFWQEHELSQDGLPVIGLQLTSADPYKDYPKMRELVAHLAEKYRVLVFSMDHSGYDKHPNVIPVQEKLAVVMALLSRCDLIVAPDSAFVHAAGAFDIPCVALYGPTDGEVFTRYYERCRYLDARREFRCIPCWRNQHLACKLTNGLTSPCLAGISTKDITEAVAQQLSKYPLAVGK